MFEPSQHHSLYKYLLKCNCRSQQSVFSLTWCCMNTQQRPKESTWTDEAFPPRAWQKEVNSPRTQQSSQQHVRLPLFTPEGWQEWWTLLATNLKTSNNFKDFYFFIFLFESYFCKGERTRSRQECPAEPRGPLRKSWEPLCWPVTGNPGRPRLQRTDHQCTYSHRWHSFTQLI